jgi:hypothetical protein
MIGIDLNVSFTILRNDISITIFQCSFRSMALAPQRAPPAEDERLCTVASFRVVGWLARGASLAVFVLIKHVAGSVVGSFVARCIFEDLDLCEDGAAPTRAIANPAAPHEDLIVAIPAART